MAMVGYTQKNLEIFALVSAALAPVALVFTATLGWPFLAVWLPLVFIAGLIQIAIVGEAMERLRNKTFLLFESCARLAMLMPEEEQEQMANQLKDKVEQLPPDPEKRIAAIERWQALAIESEYYGANVREANLKLILQHDRIMDHQMALATTDLPPAARSAIKQELEDKLDYHMERVARGARAM